MPCKQPLQKKSFAKTLAYSFADSKTTTHDLCMTMISKLTTELNKETSDFLARQIKKIDEKDAEKIKMAQAGLKLIPLLKSGDSSQVRPFWQVLWNDYPISCRHSCSFSPAAKVVILIVCIQEYNKVFFLNWLLNFLLKAFRAHIWHTLLFFCLNRANSKKGQFFSNKLSHKIKCQNESEFEILFQANF